MDFATSINQTPEAEAFLKRVAALPKQPGVSLDPVLKPSIEKEAELRRLFAQDRKNYHLVNPYVGLVSVFEAPDETGIRLTRARAVRDEEDLSARYVFPLPESRRRKDFEPCIAENLEDFQRNWNIFTEGALSQLKDWNNVIAAGGSVLGCLLPLSDADKQSRRSIRKHYHSSAYPTSDIDLFLWGLDAEQAEAKMNQIYEAVRDSVPWDVTCVRTKHAVSIHSQYPYRSVQIVLRLYQSPAEILAGFDVDTACVAYDGSRILANPRSIIALMRQANTVDMTRRSPSYEVRLAKYASRGFEVYVPDLRRADIDPTIFERSLNRITGLARLLVLEKLSKPETRISYLESRRDLRSRVRNRTIYTRRMRCKRKGDLKAEEEIAGIDMNDYDVAQMHIPYGPGWTAQRIEKLVFQTDMGINSTFNPNNKDRRLHRHVAFFGTMGECLEDLCEYCPGPRNDEEKALQEEEDKVYVRGRIVFIEEDPGRQSMTGSFNPIDIGEWSELAYLGPTEKLFAAIATSDRGAVQTLIASGEVDINRRDHVGRTALQVAALCSASDVCMDLIDAGARMTARLADGRTALHVAAQMNLLAVIEKMIQRSSQNEEKAKTEEEAKAKAAKEEGSDDEANGDESDIDRPSSDDDWSSEEEEPSKKPKEKKDESENEPDADADIPEDNVDTPDILDVNLPDWDLAFTPLDYAIVSGSKGSLQALLNTGADPKLATKTKDYNSHLVHPLSLAILIADDVRAEEIIDQLIRAGATCAQADENLFSVLHCLVLSGRTRLVEKILRSDPSAVAALNVPHANNDMVYPLVSATVKHFYSIAVLLLGYGAKVSITAEDRQKVKNMLAGGQERYWLNGDRRPHELDYLGEINLPVETALSYQSYLASLFVKLGAQVSVPVKIYFQRGGYSSDCCLSLLECVERQIFKIEKEVTKQEKEVKPLPASIMEKPRNAKTFVEARRAIKDNVERIRKENQEKDPDSSKFRERKRLGDDNSVEDPRRAVAYLKEMKALLQSVGAKTYSQIFADYPEAPRAAEPLKLESNEEEKQSKRPQYHYIKQRSWSREAVVPQLLDQYDALYEACWTGDNARVEELCLPRKSSKHDKPPLRITVISEEEYHGGGYTPFSVAILARKWDTARVILSIAKAQYKPKDETTNKNAGMGNIVFDVDQGSDYGSTVCDSDEDCYDEGDVPASGTVTDLAALAARESAVQCDVSPKLFIEQSMPTRVDRESQKIIDGGSMARQVCLEGDLEAFVNISDMMQQLPEPQEPDKLCLPGAIVGDSPEVLDEVIRRSGLGIDSSQLIVSENNEHPAPNTSKLYLGLTVHGKKRKDLARYVEGNHSNDTDEDRIPLLWTAIKHNAKKVIDYLAGPGPLAAYQYYAKTKSTERAEALRQLHDLDKQLPKLIGIVGNRRGENALTAAILSGGQDKLPLAKKVLSLFPAQKYLQSTIAYYGWAATHLAAAADAKPTFFDFLFSNGLSAELIDNKGMNVYHFVCSFGHTDLLKYFLEKLPSEVSSELLRQATRGTEETPLMAAVLNGHLKAVETLLQSGLSVVKESLAIRDAKGSMPLHVAVHKGYSKVADLLIKASPDSEALYFENGVGETVLETAWAKFLIDATRDHYPGHNFFSHRGINSLDPWDSHTLCLPPDREVGHDLDTELESLKSVYANLLRDGKLAGNVKLKDALDEFIPYFAEKVHSEAKSPEIPAEEETTDTCDYRKTFKVISKAVSALPARRQLVHLTDVQRSVRASLEKATKKPEPQVEDEYSRRYRFLNGDEIPDEAEAEAWEKHEMWHGILGWNWNLYTVASGDSNSHFGHH